MEMLKSRTFVLKPKNSIMAINKMVSSSTTAALPYSASSMRPAFKFNTQP